MLFCQLIPYRNASIVINKNSFCSYNRKLSKVRSRIPPYFTLLSTNTGSPKKVHTSYKDWIICTKFLRQSNLKGYLSFPISCVGYLCVIWYRSSGFMNFWIWWTVNIMPVVLHVAQKSCWHSGRTVGATDNSGDIPWWLPHSILKRKGEKNGILPDSCFCKL